MPRPNPRLLPVTKAMLMDLCHAADVTWRDDPTNVDPATLRGRLRRDVLPVLEELWPNAAQRTAVNAPLVQAAAEALGASAETHGFEVADYGAAKSFVLDFSQALDLELRPHGIHCTALCPGFTFSEFHDVMGTRGSVSKLPRFLWMTAEEVAETAPILPRLHLLLPPVRHEIVDRAVELIPAFWRH